MKIITKKYLKQKAHPRPRGALFLHTGRPHIYFLS